MFSTTCVILGNSVSYAACPCETLIAHKKTPGYAMSPPEKRSQLLVIELCPMV